MASDNDDLDEPCKNVKSSKKRKSFGRLTDVKKKMKLQSHEIGEPCSCKKKCFECVPDVIKKEIISNMNNMKNNDEINICLAGLISLVPIQRRRPKKDEEEASFRDCSVNYRVRVRQGDDIVEEVTVCKNAFISLHGVTRGKVECLVSKIKKDAMAPRDLRGHHNNRPRKLKDETVATIKKHISSFKSRNSHYSLVKSDRVYLDESLNITKMFEMYKEKYPEYPVSYESYRSVFNSEFNISFGYPRTDTCSTCDTFSAENRALDLKLGAVDIAEDKKERILREKRILDIKHEVHLKKQETFYVRKKNAKNVARKCRIKEAICMDYSRNFQCPNIETNDAYYKRQLSIYMFNIHVLSSNASYFYVYPETVGNKGADEVCSFLFHFVMHFLDPAVKQLEIFCDSCGGQNKNNVVFKFCHFLVHTVKRLSSIKFTYPIRGHSYLECDKNTALINKRSRCEIPADWCHTLECARVKPTPFEVINLEETPDIIRSWTNHMDLIYEKTLPFAIRPIRELWINDNHPVLIKQRTNYNGSWESVPLRPPKEKKRKKKLEFPLTKAQAERYDLEENRKRMAQLIKSLADGEYPLPEISYEGKCIIDRFIFHQLMFMLMIHYNESIFL